MFRSSIKSRLVLGFLSIVLFSACATSPKVEEFPATANSANEVTKLSKDIQVAKDAQVDVLAPASFKNAEQALKSAKGQQKDGDDASDILSSVAEGRAYLSQANQFAKLSNSNIGDVVIARKAAIDAGADQAFSEEFADADDNLRDLTTKIEKNNLSDVEEDRAILQKQYMDVELKAIKQTNLAEAQATIALAVKEGAEDSAPQSLAMAEKSVKDADAFIIANRHETDDVQMHSKRAQDAADHLLKITRDVNSGKNITSEESALSVEAQHNKVLGEKSVVQGKLADEKMKTKQMKQTAAGLAVETKDLKSEQEFNRSFEAARAQFTREEAEIYRQGNQLVIRLRALEFDANKSDLRSNNFPLLGKVAKVLKGFENSTVVVEGHTDSDGGMLLNKKLSTDRAQTVSSYLISNESIDPSKMSVVGYGFDRPLASNKTPKGKAQNRRVDIVISPKPM